MKTPYVERARKEARLRASLLGHRLGKFSFSPEDSGRMRQMFFEAGCGYCGARVYTGWLPHQKQILVYGRAASFVCDGGDCSWSGLYLNQDEQPVRVTTSMSEVPAHAGVMVEIKTYNFETGAASFGHEVVGQVAFFLSDERLRPFCAAKTKQGLGYAPVHPDRWEFARLRVEPAKPMTWACRKTIVSLPQDGDAFTTLGSAVDSGYVPGTAIKYWLAEDELSWLTAIADSLTNRKYGFYP